MALITTQELYYKDYLWTVCPNDSPKITGEPDSTLLNRKEGYEVIYFINKFCQIYSLTKKASATKVERMIRAEVPGEYRSQENIKEWIVNNWKQSKF